MKVNRFYSKDPLGREYFNPMKIAKPYLSVKEYYEKWECLLNGPNCNQTRFAHLIALLLFVPWFALYSFIYPVFERALGQGGGAAAYVFGVPLLFLLIYWGAYKFFDRRASLAYQKYQQSTPSYYSLSEKEQEDLKQRYYAYLERAYGEEAGKVLKQYFQMKNYQI